MRYIGDFTNIAVGASSVKGENNPRATLIEGQESSMAKSHHGNQRQIQLVRQRMKQALNVIQA